MDGADGVGMPRWLCRRSGHGTWDRLSPERKSETALNVALPAKNPVSAVDMFCGVGGLTHGLLKEGITVCAGVDIDPKCRYPYEKNNACLFVEEDVAKIPTTGRTNARTAGHDLWGASWWFAGFQSLFDRLLGAVLRAAHSQIQEKMTEV